MNSLRIGRFPRLGYAGSEAINTLCTNLTFSGESVKKIMLTSCHASEGKSHLSMNIMRTMARLGKSVVLVDADLRRSMIDSRFDFNDRWYTDLDVQKPFKATGDVYSRFKLRYKEIKQSMKIIKKLLKKIDEFDENIKNTLNSNLAENSMAISIVEGWRGEIVHIAITGVNGELLKYKIKDPSFNNWYMLAMAVRNNGISDFPLCNKSFNLSYCGNDL